MLISFDRTNFPLFVVEEAMMEIHLLPITRWQFHRFFSELASDEQQHYQELINLNPMSLLEQVTLADREKWFMTHILPEEALAFAHWLGNGFDLPTVDEWRTVYRMMRLQPRPHHELSAEEWISGPAEIILDQFSQRSYDLDSMVDYTLMQGGLVEWAKDEKKSSWVGLGAPRPEFHPNLWAPLRSEVKPIRPEARLPYFGFRLVRRGEWYLADRDNVRYTY